MVFWHKYHTEVPYSQNTIGFPMVFWHKYHRISYGILAQVPQKIPYRSTIQQKYLIALSQTSTTHQYRTHLPGL